MLLPHDACLAYLIALDMNDNEIVRLLEIDKLVVPTPSERARLRYTLADRSKRPWKGSSTEAGSWALYYGVDDVFRGTQASQQAFTILRSPTNRVPVEVLLLGGMKPDAVVKFAKEHELIGVSVDGVTCYERLFWSIRRLSVAEWKEFLARHPMGDVYMKVLAEGGKTAKAIAEVFLNRLPLTEKVCVDPERFGAFMKAGQVPCRDDAKLHADAGHPIPQPVVET